MYRTSYNSYHTYIPFGRWNACWFYTIRHRRCCEIYMRYACPPFALSPSSSTRLDSTLLFVQFYLLLYYIILFYIITFIFFSCLFPGTYKVHIVLLLTVRCSWCSWMIVNYIDLYVYVQNGNKIWVWLRCRLAVLLQNLRSVKQIIIKWEDEKKQHSSSYFLGSLGTLLFLQ